MNRIKPVIVVAVSYLVLMSLGQTSKKKVQDEIGSYDVETKFLMHYNCKEIMFDPLYQNYRAYLNNSYSKNKLVKFYQRNIKSR
jgi:hypothetical protein